MTKRYLQFCIVLISILVVAACSSGSGSGAANESTVQYEESQELSSAPLADESDNNGVIEYLRIKHFMVECEGYQVSHCFLAQKEGSNEWTYFYDRIQGFDYKWGTDYEILVQIQDTGEGLADVTAPRYSLLEVITETSHETREPFQYVSHKPEERIAQITPGQYMLLGNKAFTCTSESCGALISAIEQNQSTLLLFQHGANPVEPLILDAVLCSDASSSFIASCL